MNKIEEIMEYARDLFDAVGTIDGFLILGLESRKDRDLDVFIVKNGKYSFPGFAEYFIPKVELLLKKIRETGLKANQKKYSEMNIKQLAIKAGMGKWGKNSLVIHPKFGPWLRFITIKTNFYFPKEPQVKKHPIPYEECRGCSRCIKACPVKIIKNFYLSQPEKCISYLQLDNPTEKASRRCNACLEVCKSQS